MTCLTNSETADRTRRHSLHRTTPWWICLVLGFLVPGFPLAAQPPENPAAGSETDTREKILAEQARLAEQYELLERKLFSLYQYEQEQNPERAELLQRAWQQSRERLTLPQLQAAVNLLRQTRLREAEKNQQVVTRQLEELLDLLQSEDRSKRVRNQIDQYREYAKEINRILRIQQGIRGQAESGGEAQKLGQAQKQNADRTGELQREIDENESAGQAADADDQNSQNENSQNENSQNESGEKNPAGDPGPGQENRGSENQPSENAPPAQDPGQPGSGEESPQPSGQQPGPVQDKLQNAAQKMQEAREKMDRANREESIADMLEAERELEQAKRELERILRQLREEEIQRTLATLESRFRRMLEMQVKVHEDTVGLEGGRARLPLDDFEIQSGKLAVRQNSLVNDANRALLLLEDDGSSVAIAEALRQTAEDMQQVAQRLTAAKTGATTQELERGIIETLGFLVEVFEQAQEDDADSPQQPPSGDPSGQPGEQALVNQLAELKLIRGLQQQILGRHQRYARLLDHPQDAIGYTRDPGIRQALDRLSQRQSRLQKITRDIVVGKNR